MISLALESSTSRGSVAIAKDGTLLASRASYVSKKHSEFLNPAIEQCLSDSNLKLQDIDFFAVCRGPGSFTGIRVAAGAAKTLSYTLKKQLFVTTSLHLLYLQNCVGNKNVISMINAYKNMVYFSSYENNIQTTSPCAMTFEQVNSFLLNKNKTFLVVGDGYLVSEKYLSTRARLLTLRKSDKLTDLDYPTAEFLACHCTNVLMTNRQTDVECGTMDWKNFTPLYIRASEAEESLRSRI